MYLFDNPFYVLQVSTRDQSQKLVVAAEERSLILEPEICTQARMTLTNPRNRLAAEIAWLPGLAPVRAYELISKISTAQNEVAQAVGGLEPLAQCNVSAAGLIRWSLKKLDVFKSWLIFLANAYENVSAEELLVRLNEDRTIARFPEIPGVREVEEGLRSHQEYLLSAIDRALDSIPDPHILLAEVLSDLIEKEGALPVLMDEYVDRYQVHVQHYLDQLSEWISASLEGIRKVVISSGENKKVLHSRMDDFRQNLELWHQIAEPIQIKTRVSGREDSLSGKLLNEIRSMAILLANEHDLHEEAKLITEMLTTYFGDSPEFSEQLTGDLSSLDDILTRKAKSRSEYEKWVKEISLDITMGKLIKKRLAISPDGVTYNSRFMALNEITRVRWGGLSKSVNFIPAGTDYTVWVGTDREMFKIECSELQRFGVIIDKLWRAVAVRLFGETLRRLSQGEKIQFGNVVIDKNGAWLTKHNFIGTESFYARWENLSISNGPGAFIISVTDQKKIYSSLSYRDEDNIHILEAMMRFLWKDGNYVKLQRGEFK